MMDDLVNCEKTVAQLAKLLGLSPGLSAEDTRAAVKCTMGMALDGFLRHATAVVAASAHPVPPGKRY
jgi:hypothetical protein